MCFGVLILYLTHTKNYAKADFGSHSYESQSRYLHISRFVTSFLIFRELDNIVWLYDALVSNTSFNFLYLTNPQKCVDSERYSADQFAS